MTSVPQYPIQSRLTMRFELTGVKRLSLLQVLVRQLKRGVGQHRSELRYMLYEGEGKSIARMICLYGGRLPMRAAAMSIVLFVVAACGTIPTPGSTPMPQIVATRLTAEAYGKLVVVDDCLRVNTDYGTSHLLVWPPGFVLGVNGDTIRVADAITGQEADWRVEDMV